MFYVTNKAVGAGKKAKIERESKGKCEQIQNSIHEMFE